MRNDMRPELSQKNPYWIGKHRYYELKHFCLQYPIWKKARLALDGLSRRPADLQVFVSCGQVKGDPTERCAQSRIFFGERMEMVEQAAIEAEYRLIINTFVCYCRICSSHFKYRNTICYTTKCHRRNFVSFNNRSKSKFLKIIISIINTDIFNKCFYCNNVHRITYSLSYCNRT